MVITLPETKKELRAKLKELSLGKTPEQKRISLLTKEIIRKLGYKSTANTKPKLIKAYELTGMNFAAEILKSC